LTCHQRFNVDLSEEETQRFENRVEIAGVNSSLSLKSCLRVPDFVTLIITNPRKVGSEYVLSGFRFFVQVNPAWALKIDFLRGSSEEVTSNSTLCPRGGDGWRANS